MLSIIYKYLSRDDLVKHALIGYILYLGFDIIFSSLISFILVVIIAALKEIVWDKLLKKGTPQWSDFIATILLPLPLMILYWN